MWLDDYHLYPAQVDVARTDEVAVDAVTALLEHQPTTGRSSLWVGDCTPAAGVRTVEVEPDLVTVDLTDFSTGDLRTACDMSTELVEMQVQQLVWTVQDATGSSAPVRSVVGGRTTLHRPTAPDPAAVVPGSSRRPRRARTIRRRPLRPPIRLRTQAPQGLALGVLQRCRGRGHGSSETRFSAVGTLDAAEGLEPRRWAVTVRVASRAVSSTMSGKV